MVASKGTTARVSPIFPSAIATACRILELLSFRASINTSAARRPLTFLSANDATIRTDTSSSFKAAINASTTRGSSTSIPSSPSAFAADIRTHKSSSFSFFIKLSTSCEKYLIQLSISCEYPLIGRQNEINDNIINTLVMLFKVLTL